MTDGTKPHVITFKNTVIFIVTRMEATYLTGMFSGHSLYDENICTYEDYPSPYNPAFQT